MQNAYEEVFWLKWATLVPGAGGVVRLVCQSDVCSDVYRCWYSNKMSDNLRNGFKRDELHVVFHNDTLRYNLSETKCILM